MVSTKRFKILMGGINRIRGIAEKPTEKNRDDIVLRFFLPSNSATPSTTHTGITSIETKQKFKTLIAE